LTEDTKGLDVIVSREGDIELTRNEGSHTTLNLQIVDEVS
jgi:hypothetical protein